MATKLMPVVWLVVFMGVVLGRDGLTRGWLRGSIRAGGLVLGLAVVVFYLVWPALWVKTNLDDYYQKDVVSVATQEHIAQADSNDPIAPATFYFRTVLGRTTPLVLFIAVGVVVVAIKGVVVSAVFKHFVGEMGRHNKQRNRNMYVRASTVGWLLVYVVGYLLLITLAAKKADRYALPALVVLPVLAGVGFTIVWRMVKEKMKLLEGKGRRVAVVLVVGALVILQPVGWMPYTLAYNSDVFAVRPLSQQGWGEGLDAAARWLNNSPLVDRLTIASWYPGVMRTYFAGKTMSLSSRHDDRVGYVVTYRNMGGRAPDDIATNVLDEFRGREPVHVIEIGGQEYVWIYETLGLHYFPKNTGELYGEQEVGQTIVAPESWDRIRIGMSNFSGRRNTEDVVLHIREGIDAKEDIRTVTINAGEVEDGQWQEFTFEPIEGRAGEEFYIALTSEASRPGDAVTVRFVDRDVLAGQMVWRRGSLPPGENNSKYRRDNFDVAYRLPAG